MFVRPGRAFFAWITPRLVSRTAVMAGLCVAATLFAQAPAAPANAVAGVPATASASPAAPAPDSAVAAATGGSAAPASPAAGENAVHDHAAHKGGGMAGMARDQMGASAAFDSRGSAWMAAVEDGRVTVRRSGDLGHSWSAPMPVHQAPEPVEADGDARPKIAVGAAGELYVTWTRPLANPYTGFIRFARSEDGGKTWSPPITVHRDRQEITHRFDSLTVGRDGRIFVAWIDKRDGQIAKAKHENYSGAALYYAVSGDGGRSFQGDYRVADHSCECCRIALLPRPDGTVTALWRHVFDPDIRDHALAQLHADGRADGFRRATFDGWAIDACPHHGPSLAVDGHGQLHAVWFDLGPDHPGATYGRLRDGAVDGLRHIGGVSAEHPDIAASAQHVAVAWKEFDGERTQLLAMVSNDAGVSWHDMKLASTAAASDQPRLLEREGRFYVFWNTRENPRMMVPLP